jgi:hypothetical protein
MNNILIVSSILLLLIILLLILNKTKPKFDNKYYFVILSIITYCVYVNIYNKENFIFNSDQSILKLDDKIKFFENNRMTIPEYEKQFNVKIIMENDTYMEVPLAVDGESASKVGAIDTNVIVKYGDTILLQCNAMEDRYLTGNRDGYNITDQTGDNFEGVYTTNEDKSLHEWIIIPTDDNKMNTPVKLGETINLQCKHLQYTKYLVGGKPLTALLYNNTDSKCGVYTQRTDTMSDTYSSHNWVIIDDKNTTGSTDIMLKYDNLVYIRRDDKYLSGARQYGYIEGETNQQVYTVNANDGNNELLWIIKKDKGPRVKAGKHIKLWQTEPSLFAGNDAKFVSDNVVDTADSIFGDPSAKIPNDDNIINMTNENGACVNDKFIMVNFNTEKYVKSGYLDTSLNLANKIIFAVKIAGSDGIFTDINDAFETPYLFDWYKNDTEVNIKIPATPTDNYISFFNDKFGRHTMGTGATDDKYKFIVKTHADNKFSLLKQINNILYIITLDDGEIEEQMVEYDENNISNNALLMVVVNNAETYKLKNMNGDYLFQSADMSINPIIGQAPNQSWIEFNINRKIQFIKLYPIEMGTTSCSFDLKFTDMNDETITYENTPRSLTSNSGLLDESGLLDVSGLYGVDSELNSVANDELKLNSNTPSGENTELNIDLTEDKYIRGGILKNSNMVDNVVYKFEVHVAGENKIYTNIGKYKLDLNKKQQIDFEIFKTCRYVKVSIIECLGTCNFKLELY